jgi:hypothetical protein
MLLSAAIQWDLYFMTVLHEGADGIVCVIENSCGDAFTYVINGPEADFLGNGDLHESEYSSYDQFLTTINFEPFPWHDEEDDHSDVNCHYQIHIFPSKSLYDEYHTNKPAVLLTTAVMIIFAFTSLAFIVYDRLVQIRQVKVMDTAAQRSNAIVSSLFPADVRDILYYSRRKPNRKRARNTVSLER